MVLRKRILVTTKESGKKPQFQWSQEEASKPERAIVLVPVFSSSKFSETDATRRSPSSRLEEAEGLARAISLEIVHSDIVNLKIMRPSSLIGRGKIDEIADIIHDKDIGLAVVDHALSPVQQQNLEKKWNCKVLDRTGLILEIFGERAQTKEGRLQVDLAHLNYQKGRLVRQWTHLERQRGGSGFMGGPGETQIEADRREIQSKILGLKKDLEKVKRTRTLHRAQRKKIPHPVVALVGYTNAGKSTLFNKLTGAKVFAKDLLFATLDPTLRQLNLPEGTRVILSDTVGFVSNLPTHLVAAFRATLEEVLEADLILHIRDIADVDSQAQCDDVYDILGQLGIGDNGREGVVEIWNKIDLLEPEALEAMRQLKTAEGSPLLVSAITGTGNRELLTLIENQIAGSNKLIELILELDELGKLPWFYENTHIVERVDLEDGRVSLKVRATANVKEEINSSLLA